MTATQRPKPGEAGICSKPQSWALRLQWGHGGDLGGYEIRGDMGIPGDMGGYGGDMGFGGYGGTRAAGEQRCEMFGVKPRGGGAVPERIYWFTLRCSGAA